MVELRRYVVGAPLPDQLDWLPMNSSVNLPDLVPMEQDSDRYKSAYSQFYKTMDMAVYEVVRVFRIQNIKLWSKYHRCV